MKSERNAALVMIFAAMVGLLLANSPFGQPVLNAIDFKLNLDLININITIGHVVSDLFLAVFFFVAGLELKYELTTGTLSSPKRALVPVVAAIAGVAVPSAIYAYLNWGTEAIVGWQSSEEECQKRREFSFWRWLFLMTWSQSPSSQSSTPPMPSRPGSWPALLSLLPLGLLRCPAPKISGLSERVSESFFGTPFTNQVSTPPSQESCWEC
jgi:hypothetical protein